MKSLHAIGLVCSFQLVACATKKDEQSVNPQAPIQDQSSDTVSTPDCQGADCQVAVNEPGKIQILQQNSLLKGQVKDAPDSECLESLTIGAVDENLVGTLDLVLKNMNLKSESDGFAQSARCATSYQLAYKKGYAFALRALKIPLLNATHADSFALFQGVYGFSAQPAIELNQVLGQDTRLKSLQIAFTVPDQNLVWSSCSGRTELKLDTTLLTNFKVPPATDEALEMAQKLKEFNMLDHGELTLRLAAGQ